MKRMLLVGYTMWMLSGCSATSALGTVASVVSPSKPEITAQVGAENTKQGVGVVVKKEDRTEIREVQGAVNASKQSQQVQTGTVLADTVRVTNGSPGALLGAFAIGMASVLGLVFWFVPSPIKRRKDDE